MELDLPEERTYCPKLTCAVYDYMFLGLKQPTIGTFNIPLGRIKADAIQQRLTFTEQSKKLIRALREKLGEPPLGESEDGAG